MLDYSVGLNVGGGAGVGAHTGAAHSGGGTFSKKIEFFVIIIRVVFIFRGWP